jgi:hypothetical protein
MRKNIRSLRGSALRRSAWVVTCACLVASSLAACAADRGQPSSSLQPGGGALYAYLTHTQLGLVDDTTVVARATGDFTASFGDIARPIWTLDGRYAAAISGVALLTQTTDPDYNAQTLVIIDAATRAVRQIACPGCTSLAAVGGSQLLASDTMYINHVDRTNMLRFNLASSQPPELVQTRLPNFDLATTFLAGTSGSVLVVGATVSGTSARNVPERLFLLRPDGSAVTLNHVIPPAAGSAFPAGPATLAQDQHGAMVFVLQAGWLRRACNEQHVLLFVNPAASPLVPAEQTAPIPAGYMAIDLWWDSGHIYATLQDRRCAAGNSPAGPASTVWRLDTSHWTQLGSMRVLALRRLSSQTKAIVVPAADEGATGTLYTDLLGRRTAIARSVLAIATP